MSTTTTISIKDPSRVIIIGAGWNGLAAAKTYLQVRPNVVLSILDSDSSIGGVWSSSRTYPGMIADSCAAIFDYSDFPMHEELGIGKWADLPGEKVHEYLERYADKFDLRKRCKLNTKVVRVEREESEDGVWKVEIEIKKDFEDYPVREFLFCDKLIVATGATSTPNFPPGLDYTDFNGIVMHFREVGAKHTLLTAEKVKRVTVVGGSKSAVDVVSLCALAGKEVDWIIREEGFGPAILFEPRVYGVHAGAIKNIRATTLFSPSMLWTKGLWYRFLHGPDAKLGAKLMKWAIGKGSRTSINDFYGKNENTMKLAPDMQNLFWSNASISVIHDEKLMEMIADGSLIHIHRASISSTSPTEITLSNATVLTSDALVFCTGWTTSQPSLFSPTLLEPLGLPFPLSNLTPTAAKHWETIEHSQTSKIKALFPHLSPPPGKVQRYDAEHSSKMTSSQLTPFRLFRGMIPPAYAASDKNDIVFLGTLLNTAVPTYAEIESLFSVAYLEKLPFAAEVAQELQSEERMHSAIAEHNAFGVLRTRCDDFGTGGYYDGSAEIQGFQDLLMRDLGLKAQRKKAKAMWGVGWVEEWFWPYSGRDYSGLVAEYMERWVLGGKEGKML